MLPFPKVTLMATIRTYVRSNHLPVLYLINQSIIINVWPSIIYQCVDDCLLLINILYWRRHSHPSKSTHTRSTATVPVRYAVREEWMNLTNIHLGLCRQHSTKQYGDRCLMNTMDAVTDWKPKAYNMPWRFIVQYSTVQYSTKWYDHASFHYSHGLARTVQYSTVP